MDATESYYNSVRRYSLGEISEDDIVKIYQTAYPFLPSKIQNEIDSRLNKIANVVVKEKVKREQDNFFNWLQTHPKIMWIGLGLIAWKFIK